MERWRDVVGFGNYEVSNTGRVKSKERTERYYRGNKLCERTRHEKILKPYTEKGRYKFVGLRKDGESYTKRIHTLVADAFLGEAKGREVNHIDGNKLNNNVENLEYCTHKENIEKAWENGLCDDNQKLSNEDAVIIKEMLRDGHTRREIADKFDLGINTITSIKTGRSWAWVDVEGFEENSVRKLTDEDVGEIRELLQNTSLTQREIGEMFGVDHSMISRIKSKERR